MADPILEFSLKTGFKTVLYHFLMLNKSVDKFQLCHKIAAGLFPFSSITFLITQRLYWTDPYSF